MTEIAAAPSTRLIDWACLRACWRLGRQPFRYAGTDSAFTSLGALLLVIAGSLAIHCVAPGFTFALSLFLVLACLAPADAGAGARAGAPRPRDRARARDGGLPDLPLGWQLVTVAVSREMQGGLHVLALAPARRQVGRRRRLRIALLLGVAALAARTAAAELARPA